MALAAHGGGARVGWRFARAGGDGDARDALKDGLIGTVDETGFTYLTRTLVQGRVAVRLSIGNLMTERRHVLEAWDHIREAARGLSGNDG